MSRAPRGPARAAASPTKREVVNALRLVAEGHGPFYERHGDTLACVMCGVTIDPDGRQPHEGSEDGPCPVEILDDAVLDAQGVPRRDGSISSLDTETPTPDIDLLARVLRASVRYERSTRGAFDGPLPGAWSFRNAIRELRSEVRRLSGGVEP